jgi:hypothetical protein
MKLKCIKIPKMLDPSLTNPLIVGNYYKVTDQDKIGYKVIDEFNRNWWFYKENFEPIEETRNTKINNLLNDYN